MQDNKYANKLVAKHYRLVQYSNFESVSNGFMLVYIFPTEYQTMSAAVEKLREEVAVNRKILAESNRENAYMAIIEDSYAEIFYQDEKGKRHVTDRFYINAVEAYEQTGENGQIFCTWTYRKKLISVNKQKNRYFIEGCTGGIRRRHSLKAALEFIDRDELNHMEGKC